MKQGYNEKGTRQQDNTDGGESEQMKRQEKASHMQE